MTRSSAVLASVPSGASVHGLATRFALRELPLQTLVHVPYWFPPFPHQHTATSRTLRTFTCSPSHAAHVSPQLPPAAACSRSSSRAGDRPPRGGVGPCAALARPAIASLVLCFFPKMLFHVCALSGPEHLLGLPCFSPSCFSSVVTGRGMGSCEPELKTSSLLPGDPPALTRRGSPAPGL